MNYGTRIAELREHKGLKQEELAQSLGITRAALSHYEKNRRKPDFEILTKLADIFGVTIDYLVGRTSQPTAILDSGVREFVDQLELSDEDILRRFNLTIDGRTLTEEEAKRFIAFVRMERMME
ncbi:helix-turn-helix transcriptional regulator [Paenibacillus sp. EKM102P]|uniref:helix-turn-helix domain-containing protein n=1 Tax=unclassified Paenibacillus TaxID=185978 RepID=UPI00142DE50D|nr:MULTISPECIES: helix-turn-helix transcriptional regulator [unclassified Paenibacillus]KAF6618358.1 helix-turn-helix transcriptional regulator [Paenibacillus sp. EKM101P]KAF6624704.1 helix-turn-helix transcriptional regulator [Paenibacillus sp. EKM102P]KAF6635517.1 helix-turn-helix transcriptional regulator [Paenibacillus sp. EKM10P]KAF6648774.1 helix-turn-helix transcriptional regulator [Paenibacillus sp. EKM11P]